MTHAPAGPGPLIYVVFIVGIAAGFIWGPLTGLLAGFGVGVAFFAIGMLAMLGEPSRRAAATKDAQSHAVALVLLTYKQIATGQGIPSTATAMVRHLFGNHPSFEQIKSAVDQAVELALEVRSVQVDRQAAFDAGIEDLEGIVDTLLLQMSLRC